MRKYNINTTNFTIPEKARYIAVDIETTGLCPLTDTIVGISWSFDDREGYYTTDVSNIKEILSSAVPKIFHNAVFDLKFLKNYGYEVNGTIYDTMILAKISDQDRKFLGLKDLTAQYFDEEHICKAKTIWHWLASNGLGKNDLSKAPKKMLAEYAIEDVLNTYGLFKLFTQKLIKIKDYITKLGYNVNPFNVYKEEDGKIIPVVVNMELSGVKVDLEQAAYKKLNSIIKQNKLKSKFPNNEHIEKVEQILLDKKIIARKKRNKTGVIKKMPKKPTFNWDSNNQLKILFYEVLGEKPTKFTKTGKPSIDVEVLESFSEKYPWINKLIEHKKLEKLKNTYLGPILEKNVGGRLYANFNITGTATGRFSSSNPNFQNIPRNGGIKEIFVPKKDHIFIYADYSQLELRIAAHLSEDSLLMNSYLNNLDLHKQTASIVFNKPEADITKEERQVGKTINFAIIYNAGGYRLADELGYLTGIDPDNKPKIMTQVKRGDAIKKRIFDQYTGLAKFINKNLAILRKYNIAVTEFGRVRYLPDIRSDQRGKANHALKSGFNMFIQSFGASITKRAMIQLDKAGYKIVNQIHDAIYIEHPLHNAEFAKKHIQHIMENVVKLKVPLIAEPKLLTSFCEEDIYEEQCSEETKEDSKVSSQKHNKIRNLSWY